MNPTTKKPFSLRACTSVSLTLACLGLAFTGCVLFFVPPGRVANWTGWTFLGLSKQQWGGLHIWVSLLFLVAGLLHLTLNWRPLWRTLCDRAQRRPALRAEWLAALALVALIAVGSIAGLPPFSSLLDWQESVKFRSDRGPDRAPIAHAERLTLAELAAQVPDTDEATLRARLQSHGADVTDPNATLRDLADARGATPRQLYEWATGVPASASGPRARGGRGGFGAGGPGFGGGFGRLSLAEYCEQTGLDLDRAQAILQGAGIPADADTSLRDLADTAGRHPSELRQLLE